MRKDLMETLQLTHEWAVDRLHHLCEYNLDKDLVESLEDAYSIKCEFAEWLDPDAGECEIYSLPQFTDD